MVFIGGNKRQVKNELLEIICLSLEKFLTSIPFHKVGKNIKDFLLWFASPKTFPKIPKTILWPWPQLVAIYTPLITGDWFDHGRLLGPSMFKYRDYIPVP